MTKIDLTKSLIGRGLRISRLRQNKIMGVVLLFSLLITLAGSINFVKAQEIYGFVNKWGSIGSDDGQFSTPIAVTLDSLGNVYVLDKDNNRVQKFDSSGHFISKWGSRGQEDGQLSYPFGIAIDSDGFIYIADTSNNRVEKFTNNGVFVLKWGSYGSDYGQFDMPVSVAVDNSGNVYVVEFNRERVQKFTSTGTFITQWRGSNPGLPNGVFNYPFGIAIDNSGYVYVTDGYAQFYHRVQKFDSNGAFITQWGSLGTGSGNGQFNYPRGLAVGNDGFVYVTESGNDRVQKFTTNGDFITTWGSLGSNDGQFDNPTGVAVDSAGYVYVVDSYNNRVQRFAPPLTYLVSVNSDPTNVGSINVDGNSYSNGQTLQLLAGLHNIQANAPSGYDFASWVTTGGVSVSGSTATVTGAGSIKAIFTLSLNSLTFQTDPADVGPVLFNGVNYYNGQTGQYAVGTYSVSSNAPSGYVFSSWVTTGGVSVSGSTATVTGAGSIKAVFGKPDISFGENFEGYSINSFPSDKFYSYWEGWFVTEENGNKFLRSYSQPVNFDLWTIQEFPGDVTIKFDERMGSAIGLVASIASPPATQDTGAFSFDMWTHAGVTGAHYSWTNDNVNYVSGEASASTDFVPEPGVWYNIKMAFYGGVGKFYVDDSFLFEYDFGGVIPFPLQNYALLINTWGQRDIDNIIVTRSDSSLATITFQTDPANIGSILFDSMNYINNQIGQYEIGNYAIATNAPAGWTFDHWITTGGVNLLDSSTVEVTSSGTIKANFVQSPANRIELTLNPGWNMVSFPVTPPDTSFANIFSGKGYYQVLTWTGTSYVTPSNVEAGKGYWILVLSAITISIEGNPVNSYSSDLPAGWSMIGSINGGVVSCTSVFPSYYQSLTWSGTSYTTTTTIEPGKGYWALVLTPTHITVG